MRLLYVSGTYAPNAFAGSELSAHTLIRHLQQRHGLEVLVASDERYAPAPTYRAAYDGIELRGLRQEHRFNDVRAVVDAFAPHVIYTQAWWHDVALQVANERRIPAIVRLADSSFPKRLLTSPETRPSAIVALSREMHARAARLRIPAIHLPSFIDFEKVRTRNGGSGRRFITMMNPVREKGGFTFREIVARAPERRFAVVPGWWSLRDATGRFDSEKFERAGQSAGQPFDGRLPSEPDFSGLANLTMLPPRDAVHEIYDQTRILLVPSLWKEQFGRVVYEGAANGALVIASGMDSLKQNAGDAAVFVDRYKNPKAWLDRIRDFDDPEAYERARRRGNEYVLANYSLENAADGFLELVRRILTRSS